MNAQALTSPNALRRLLLVTLILASGCGALQTQYGYQWVYDPNAPDCPSYTWKQVSADSVQGLCSDGHRAAARNTSCAIGCMVVSPFTEEEARHIDLWGQSLRDHEVEYHVKRKLRHPA